MKKLAKNAAGFGVVEGLLILVVIGIIGFAGYYVFQARKEVDKSLDNAASSQDAQNELSKAKEIEKQRFKNDELGLSFSYPKAWGEASIVDEAYAEDQSGNRTVYAKAVKFGNNSKLKIVSNSTVKIMSGPDGVFSPAAFIDWCEKGSAIGAVYHGDEAKSCAIFEGASEQEKLAVVDKSNASADPAALLFTSFESHNAAPARKPLTVLLVRTKATGEFRTALFILEGKGETQNQELLDLYKSIK